MSKQTVLLTVPISGAWDAGDRIEVFTDFGDGSLDMAAPLLVRGLDLFPGRQAARPVGRRAVGRSRVGDGHASRPKPGVGHSVVGVTPVGRTPTYVPVAVDVPAAFGKWKFGVRVVDADGNVQGGGLQEIELVVSGTEPAPLTSFAFASYDSESDQVTFDIVRSAE